MTEIDTTFDLDPFCPECPVFEPEVKVEGFWADNKIHRSLKISCEHIDQCRRIRDHYKKVEVKDERSSRNDT